MLEKDLKHVVGNAVFALETNLSCIKARLLRNPSEILIEELKEICDSMQISLEKIKTFVQENKNEF